MSASCIVRVGLIQRPSDRGVADNLEATAAMIRRAAQRGAQIVATQELFTTHYFPQTESAEYFPLAEPIPGPTTKRLGLLAEELGIDIVASLFERRAQGIYHNTAIVIDPHGQVVSRYRKMHIPEDPSFFEKYYFTPGDSAHRDNPQAGWQAYRTKHATIGTLVCWDQWFPEAARLTALKGAQILFYPTAIGWHRDESTQERARQREAWQIVQRSHAITNGVYVAAINRVGREGDLEFWGTSFVCDPGGDVIAQAHPSDPEILIADCDLSHIDEHRQNWPFLRDRRIDAYQGIMKRFTDIPPDDLRQGRACEG